MRKKTQKYQFRSKGLKTLFDWNFSSHRLCFLLCCSFLKSSSAAASSKLAYLRWNCSSYVTSKLSQISAAFANSDNNGILLTLTAVAELVEVLELLPTVISFWKDFVELFLAHLVSYLLLFNGLTICLLSSLILVTPVYSYFLLSLHCTFFSSSTAIR